MFSIYFFAFILPILLIAFFIASIFWLKGPLNYSKVLTKTSKLKRAILIALMTFAVFYVFIAVLWFYFFSQIQL